MATINYNKQDLVNFLLSKLGITSITPLIDRQITNFRLKFNFTYLEIARCVCYAVEKRGFKYNPLYGIGGIINVRAEAAAYFKEIERQKEEAEKESKRIAEYRGKDIYVAIENIPDNIRKPHYIDLSKIKLTDDD